MGLMHHSLQLFVGGCPLCRQMANIVEVGKCAGCKLEVFDLSKDFPKVEDLVKRYRIRAVPTLVIDGKIKIEGVPTFRLVCDDSTYKFLEENFRIS